MAEGLKAVVAEMAEAPLKPAEAEQADMFGRPDMPQPVTPVAAPAGPGRPKGSRNKSTEEWKQYLLGRYVHPVEALLQIASRSPRELAEELELYRRDDEGAIMRDARGQPLLQHDALRQAFDRQMTALQAAAPYLMQRQPLAVVMTERKVGKMVMQFGASAGGSHAITPVTMRPVQNQWVTDLEPEQSDGAHDVDASKPLEGKDNPDAAS